MMAMTPMMAMMTDGDGGDDSDGSERWRNSNADVPAPPPKQLGPQPLLALGRGGQTLCYLFKKYASEFRTKSGTDTPNKVRCASYISYFLFIIKSCHSVVHLSLSLIIHMHGAP